MSSQNGRHDRAQGSRRETKTSVFMAIGIVVLSVSSGARAHDPEEHSKQKKLLLPITTPMDAALVRAVSAYREAMSERSIEKMGKAVDPDLLVLEGVHKNVGWKDYRDNHLGPEMKEWSEFAVTDSRVLESRVAGDLGYLVAEATYRIVTSGKTVTLAVAETFVLTRGPAGWRIRHVHMSSKKQPHAAALPQPQQQGHQH